MVCPEPNLLPTYRPSKNGIVNGALAQLAVAVFLLASLPELILFLDGHMRYRVVASTTII
jgi:hypothetical protein